MPSLSGVPESFGALSPISGDGKSPTSGGPIKLSIGLHRALRQSFLSPTHGASSWVLGLGCVLTVAVSDRPGLHATHPLETPAGEVMTAPSPELHPRTSVRLQTNCLTMRDPPKVGTFEAAHRLDLRLNKPTGFRDRTVIINP